MFKRDESKRGLAKYLLLSLMLLLLPSVFAQQSQKIIVSQPSDIRSWDPHRSPSTLSEAVAINVFDYLIMSDGEGNPQPSLATEWAPISPTVWEFKLREGVVWHDGEPFTAEDVKFTLERAARDPESVYKSTFDMIEEVVILGDYEIEIHTREPDPILLRRLNRTGAGILPKHHAEEVGDSGLATSPIGTGPYKLAEWSRDEFVRLVAFGDHWRGQADYDEVVFRVIPEAATRVNELITGGVQIATQIPPADADRIDGSGQATVKPHAAGRVVVLQLNTSPTVITGDKLVREAIDYAIDNQLIIDALYGGFGTPARLRITQGVVSPPELYGEYLYDPERAMTLLQEAGYAPGEAKIKIQGPVGLFPEDGQVAELIGVMLEAAGFDVELELMEWGVFQDRVRFHNVDAIAVDGLGNSMRDSWFALRGYVCGGDYIEATNWCDEEFTRLVDIGATEVVESVRTDALNEAFLMMADERPEIGIFDLMNLAGVSNATDWHPRPDELLWMYDAHPMPR